MILSLVSLLILTSCEPPTKVIEDDIVYTLDKTGNYYEVNGVNDYTIKSAKIKDNIHGINVNTIIKFAFQGCSNLESVDIPHTINKISNYAFYNCLKLKDINVDPNNLNYKSIDGNLYNKNADKFIKYAPGKKDECFAIPSTVITVENMAFSGVLSLKSITIPSGVSKLGEEAFSHVKNLHSIEIPASVTEVGMFAFYGCDNLTNVTINNNLKIISQCMFSYCKNLKEIKLPDSVLSLENGAFLGCSNLEKVELGSNIKYIAGSVFSECEKIKYNSYDNGLYLGNLDNPYLALVKCNSLEINNLVINENTKVIAGDALSDAKNLTNVTLVNGLISIGPCAFYECNNLLNVTIPDTVEIIGEFAFAYSGLEYAVLPNSLKEIGSDAFGACDNLTKVYYRGNEAEWNAIVISTNPSLEASTKYYYSETQPSTKGNYWYYDNDNNIVIW